MNQNARWVVAVDREQLLVIDATGEFRANWRDDLSALEKRRKDQERSWALIKQAISDQRSDRPKDRPKKFVK